MAPYSRNGWSSVILFYNKKIQSLEIPHRGTAPPSETITRLFLTHAVMI